MIRYVHEQGKPTNEQTSKMRLALVFAIIPLRNYLAKSLLCKGGLHELLSVLVQVSLSEGKDTEDQTAEPKDHAPVNLGVFNVLVFIEKVYHGR